MGNTQSELSPENLYYGITLLIHHVPLYLAWIDADTGRILTTDGSLIIFNCMEKREDTLQKRGMRREDDESVYDIDSVADWLRKKSEAVPANELNTFWNFCDDIARSTHRYFYGNRKKKAIDAVYDKLFFACNLPAIRNDGDEYVPVWKKQEWQLLRKAIRSGLSLLQSELDKRHRLKDYCDETKEGKQ